MVISTLVYIIILWNRYVNSKKRKEYYLDLVKL